MRYFKVEAKCGHVRRNNYILKEFYVKAESKKEAARILLQCRVRGRRETEECLCLSRDPSDSRYNS